MRNFANYLEELVIQRGLYRVWVPVREGNRERLISIWSDPSMQTFEAQGEAQTGNATEKHAIAPDCGAQAVEEPEEPCPRAAKMPAPQRTRQKLLVTVMVH